eukprot:TRINITY_DN36495_c0_g1_i1.p1 TRINITY_DN36495_c0_g1~~TRINITY_DN36495_c0_g1_i1.p1  ORF type:complete len:276 (-),score=65.24 TRINITY_DN36495_c0_g1_i1:718-1545(-)
MAATRTGVYLEDFLDEFSSMPAELQRTLFTIRELDERYQGLQIQIKEQLQQCLELPPLHQLKCSGAGGGEQADRIEKLRKEIAANQERAVGLSTEKVLLAQQALELLDGHAKRLSEDLTNFQQELKQDGRLVSPEPIAWPPPPPSERRRGGNVFLGSRSAEPRLGVIRAELGKRDREDYESDFTGPDTGWRGVSTLDPTWENGGDLGDNVLDREWERQKEREGRGRADRNGDAGSRERGGGLMPPPPPAQRRRSGPSAAQYAVEDRPLGDTFLRV